MKCRVEQSLFILWALVILPISCLAVQETEWQAFISTTDVKAVLDDGEFLWLGTEGGLLHFHKNGSVVERFLGIDFGLPTSEVTCLARNADGRLWIGTVEGAALFDGKSFVPYHYVNDRTGLAEGYIREIVCDPAGNVWFTGGFRGIGGGDGSAMLSCLRYDRTWKNYDWRRDYPGNPSGFCMQIMNEQFIFLGTDMSLFYFDNGVWTHYDLRYGDTGDNIESQYIYSLQFDLPNLTLWAATEHGLYSLKPSVKPASSFIVKHTMKGIELADMLMENSDLFWVATAQEGLYRYSRGIYEPVSQLSSIKANCIIMDGQRTKWIGQKNGITKFSQDHSETFNVGNGLRDNWINAIGVDSKDTIWFVASTIDGDCLGYYDGQRFHYEGETYGYIDQRRFFVDSKDRVWVISDSNPSGLSSKQVYFYINHKRNMLTGISNISIITEDDESNIWLAGKNTLIKLDQALNSVDYSAVMLSLSLRYLPRYPTALFVDCANNSIWLGLSLDGIARIDLSDMSVDQWNDQNSIVTYGEVCKFTKDHAGVIWAAYGPEFPGGILLFKDDVWQRAPISDWGYATEYVSDLEVDADGRVWFTMWGCNTGGSYGAGVGLFDGSTWTNFTTMNSGLVHNQVTGCAIDRQGDKWFSTHGGICVYRENGRVTEIDKADSVPSTHRLFVVYPNPFNQGAAVTFSFDESERLSEKSLSFYNTLGQLVERNELSALAPGEHTLRFDGNDAEGQELPSGIYIFQLRVGDYHQSLKATLFR